MLKALRALILLAIAQPAMAANWLRVGNSPNGITSYVDLSSIKMHGQYKRSWIKKTFPKDPKMYNATSEVVLYYVNCSELSSAVKSFVIFDSSHRTVFNGTNEESKLDFVPNAPETIGGDIDVAICKR